jgi:hypothetical protein
VLIFFRDKQKALSGSTMMSKTAAAVVALALISKSEKSLAQQYGTLQAEVHPSLSMSVCDKSGCESETKSM